MKHLFKLLLVACGFILAAVAFSSEIKASGENIGPNVCPGSPRISCNIDPKSGVGFLGGVLPE